jgi:hypothetical protein
MTPLEIDTTAGRQSIHDLDPLAAIGTAFVMLGEADVGAL